MQKCVICQKPLSLTERVVIQETKKICACTNHVHQGQLLVAVIEDLIFILDGKNDFPLIWDTIRPTLLKAGMEKARYYLQENRDHWSQYLAKKDFSTMQAKVAYFRKVLENNLAEYHYVPQKVYEKANIDDGMAYRTVIPKRKKRKTLNEILGGSNE